MAIVIASQSEPIPGYTLIEPLGQGGFGDVWRAEMPGGIPKAIKFVKGNLNDADGHVPAVQELKSLNRVKEVRHPFILAIERVDIVDGQLMIVMELADRNLNDRLEQCRGQGLPGIPRPELLRYMHETAEALDLMNSEYQLQHLDIKPQNLFLVRNHVKVADFGLVKDLEGMTAVVTSGVTPVYASPETFEGKISRFSDQYSLGIVYMEMLTGTRPFNGKNARQLMMQHVKAPPDLTALPPADRELVGRALAKNPNERFPTCGDFVRALKQSPAGPVTVVPTAPAEPRPVEQRAPTVETPGQPRQAAADPPRRAKSVTNPSLDLFALSEPESRTLSNQPDADVPPPAPGGDDILPPRPKKHGTGDTVEMAGSGKNPTLPMNQAPQKSAVTCPRCGTALLNPGQFAWCSGCGYCTDEDAAPARSGAGWQTAAGLLLLLGGFGAGVFYAVQSRLLPLDNLQLVFNRREMWGALTLVVAGAAVLAIVLVMYLGWARRGKRRKGRRPRARRPQ